MTEAQNASFAPSEGAKGMRIRGRMDPALRTPAEPVRDFGPDLQRLADRMVVTMREAKGVGLAANQVGFGIRLFVWNVGDGPMVVVNPSLDFAGFQDQVAEEGCLSMPGKMFRVARAARVTLRGQDLEGRSVRLKLKGFPARVVQHEVDHLNGLLIRDVPVAAGNDRSAQEGS